MRPFVQLALDIDPMRPVVGLMIFILLWAQL